MKSSKHTYLLLAIFPFLLGGCNNKDAVVIEEKVTITFVQHPFFNFSYDDKGERNGYYFKDEVIETTNIEFDKGHFLSQDEIDTIKKDKLKYKVPELNGGGYWSFTFFVTNYNSESGLANNYLEPQELNEDFNIYFAIYG